MELFDETVRGDTSVLPELKKLMDESKKKKSADLKNIQQYVGFSGSNLIVEWSEAILVADLKLIEEIDKLLDSQ